MKKYNWYDAYKILAEELKKFYENFENDRSSIKENYAYAGEKFFAKCLEKQNFYSLFNWARNISEASLDPFHIFVSFNNNNTTLDKKTERLQFYLEILDYHINIEEYSLDNRSSVPHIPVLQLLTNRPKESQDEIWKFFIGIIEEDDKAIKQGFEKHYKWYGIGFVVITEMLFWVNSSKYISLDKNTEKILLENNVITVIPKNYSDYMTFIKKRTEYNENIFRSIVRYAYKMEDPEDSEDRQQLFNFLCMPDKIETIVSEHTNFYTSNFSDFRFAEKKVDVKFQLVALKVISNTDTTNTTKEIIKYTKNLRKDTLYQFNQNFEFHGEEIFYNQNKELDLYSIKISETSKIDINIDVIVGENGSGKSTLLELAFMIINNISRKIFERQGLASDEIQINYIRGLYAELYFMTDHLYKIKINDQDVTVEQYQQLSFKKEVLTYGNPENCTELFNFDRLYYTNHINYSLHSLNQNYFGDWIYNLFHKNDSYETPIVLEPYREKGNIDINLLTSLMKNRLLSYILDNGNNSFRQLTKKAKAKELVLCVNYSKICFGDIGAPSEEYVRDLLVCLGEIFEFDTNDIFNKINYTNDLQTKINYAISDNIPLDILCKELPIEYFFVIYITYKLKTMVEKYKEVSEFKEHNTRDSLTSYFKFIKTKTSHITFKIRQAIYNLKYLDRLKYKNERFTLELDGLANVIENEILAKEMKNHPDLTIIDLIPSSILSVDIILENGEFFDSLSSGEKQKIFVINSIMYHLRNIASKEHRYRNVNIVLDEIELYFHPEMQKDFIHDLIEMIKNNEYIYKLSALNFILITHSPFILSDVTHNHLLMLDKYATPLINNKKTFGANIYDLLHNSFFMEDGFMGKFAEEKITQVIDIIKLYKIFQEEANQKHPLNLIKSYQKFYMKEDIPLKDRRNDIISTINDSKKNLFDIVHFIGEPILRNKLLDELKSIFEKVDDITTIIDSIKYKTTVEIRKELEKYDTTTKQKILNKLFGISND